MLQKNPRPIPIDKKQIYDISEKIAKKVISWAKQIEQLSIMIDIGLDQLTLNDNATVEKIPKHKKFTFKTSFKTPTDKLLNRDIYIEVKGGFTKLSSSTKELVIPVIVDLIQNRPLNKNGIVGNASYDVVPLRYSYSSNIIGFMMKKVKLHLSNTVSIKKILNMSFLDIVGDIYGVLLHEFTHTFDFSLHKIEHRKKIDKQKQQHRSGSISYYDIDSETRAFAQEIANDVVTARKKYKGTFEHDFNTMHFDKALAKYSERYDAHKGDLQPRKDMYINRIAYQELIENGMVFKRNIPYVPSGVAYDVFGLKTNPSTHKTTLVPKEKVRLKGFTQEQKKAVEKEIPYVLGHIEKMKGKKILFPSPIRPMTKEEFMHGRSIVDSGHPLGAGHGQYDARKKDIAINKNMDIFDLITNVCHENLHHAYPHWSEEQVRDTTGECMFELYGVYHLGRPFAEEKRKNPKKKR